MVLLRFCLAAFVLFCHPSITSAQGKANHSNITVSELQKRTGFAILTPSRIPAEWVLEIKEAPWIMLHYVDRRTGKLMAGIYPSRAMPLSHEDFPHSEQVRINGNKGYFSAWENSGGMDKDGERIAGGLLRWVQAGTYIEMYSTRLSKEQMLEIAESMN